MGLSLTSAVGVLSGSGIALAPVLLALISVSNRSEVYNILWALVFGFATLNILGLVARRFDASQRPRLSFGEMIAILVVVVSVLLLGWEMLYFFKILPIRIEQ
ncbi:MAG TPA: hypothetical protein VGF06_02360 [Terriglobales bacterium]|jgi:hypothetical protein